MSEPRDLEILAAGFLTGALTKVLPTRDLHVDHTPDGVVTGTVRFRLLGSWFNVTPSAGAATNEADTSTGMCCWCSAPIGDGLHFVELIHAACYDERVARDEDVRHRLSGVDA